MTSVVMLSLFRRASKLARAPMSRSSTMSENDTSTSVEIPSASSVPSIEVPQRYGARMNCHSSFFGASAAGAAGASSARAGATAESSSAIASQGRMGLLLRSDVRRPAARARRVARETLVIAPHRRGAMSASRTAALAAVLALASACQTPVAVEIAAPRTIHRYLTQSALSSDQPSTFSLIELRRYDLLDAFDKDPDAALGRLRELALLNDLPPEALFALAELSFLHAEETRDPALYGAAALYAYAFLFPEVKRAPLDPLDPRSRISADLYNRALASAFQRAPDGSV